jgi:hypothetical protein
VSGIGLLSENELRQDKQKEFTLETIGIFQRL